MFENVKTAPPDAILGLTEAFKADTNPDKINLSVGVYQAADGKTPIFEVVKAAERKRLEDETSKAYMPMTGDPAYGKIAARLQKQMRAGWKASRPSPAIGKGKG